MTVLIITARFPTGQFLAHNGQGWPEWPPSPARLVTAILAAAYRSGSGVAVARRLFELPPPVIATPPASERATEVRRWVPVDVTLDLRSGRIGRGGVTDKLAKPPERGTVVGDHPVEYRFGSAALSDAELNTLDAVLLQVPYLGRPTSPVVLDRQVEPSVVDPNSTTWSPDPNGDLRVQVAAPQLLEALDAREQEREAMGITGHHPRLSARPFARYSRRLPSDADPGDSHTATGARVIEVIEGLTYYQTRGAQPLDVVAITEALRTQTTSRAIAVPVYGALTREGRETPRLFGVAVTGTGPIEAWCLINGQLEELKPAIMRGTTVERRLIAEVWGTGRAWTTLAPLPNQPGALREELTHLAEGHQVEIADATLHAAARSGLAPNVEFNPQLTHVSVLFDDAIEGPLTLSGTALVPFPM